MIEAGVRVLREWEPGWSNAAGSVAAIYLAMQAEISSIEHAASVGASLSLPQPEHSNLATEQK